MTIDDAILEWESKSRRMGCVSASSWFCSRVPEFGPHRITRYTQEGEVFEHVVASDGKVFIDLVPALDAP